MELGKIGLPRVHKKKKNHNNMFENFKCLKDTSPLPFSQLHIYYYGDVVQAVVREVQLEDG